jgi:hypothetical protein
MSANRRKTDSRKVPKSAWKKGTSGNPKGRPHEGESWTAIIKDVGNMSPADIVMLIGKDNDLAAKLQNFPQKIQMKYLVIARAFAELVAAPTSGLFGEFITRMDGPAPMHGVSTFNEEKFYLDNIEYFTDGQIQAVQDGRSTIADVLNQVLEDIQLLKSYKK